MSQFVVSDGTVIPEEVSMMVSPVGLGAADGVISLEGAGTVGIPRIKVVRCLSQFGRELECFFVACRANRREKMTP